MVSSVAVSTLRQYDTTFRLWWHFCSQEGISNFEPTTAQVLQFLQHLANNSNIKYGTFNSHTSALSFICSKDLGSDLIIKRFKKGLFRLRPSLPRYDSTWDPIPLLQYIEKLTIPIDIQTLSRKLVTLLALITAERLQTISLIRLSNMIESSTGLSIIISDPIKTSRLGQIQPTLHIPKFKENTSLCVFSTIKEYIERTRPVRKSECDYLFLTIKKPHDKASKDTLGRWVKQMLFDAGLDTKQFKPHSTRHASASAALRKGISVDLICKTAGWSQESTFARFYNRPLRSDHTFAKSILDITL